MAKQVVLKREKGPGGVAQIRVKGSDVEITFAPVPENPKTKKPARASFTVVVPKDTVAEYVLDNLAVVKRWNVSLNKEEDKILGANPCSTTLEMRFERFWSAPVSRDDPKLGYTLPVPVPQVNTWGKTQYMFTAVFQPLDEDWTGFTGRLMLDHANMVDDGEGSMGFVMGRGGSDAIRQFLLAVGVDVDDLLIPYSSNLLGPLHEAIEEAGNNPVFVMFGETGFIETLSPSPRKLTKPAKKTTKKK